MTPDEINAELRRIESLAPVAPEQVLPELEHLNDFAAQVVDGLSDEATVACADEIAEMFDVIASAMTFARKWGNRTEEVTRLLAAADPVLQEYVIDLSRVATAGS